MCVKLLGLGLLLVLVCPSWAKEQMCLTSASSCEECIQSGPLCGWCTAPNANVRCQTLRVLQRAGCPKSHIYNPKGKVQVVKNDSSTEPLNTETLFIQPQEVSLRLRPGVSQSFPLTVTMPTDQPVTELSMDTSPLPVGVNITFSGIMNGNPVVVQVNVEAAQCLSESDASTQKPNRTEPLSVHITPRGLSPSVKLEITTECQCDCTSNREENSPVCGGHGTHVCGQCECYEPYSGPQCQQGIDTFFSRSEDFCRSGPNASLCSGRGKCIGGYCECEERVNPTERYTGEFCQCSNFDCPYHNSRICGGNGRCDCGRCVCDDDWTEEDCSCSMDTAACMAQNQQLCNGRGSCLCGTCQCDPKYRGPTCEDCPFCPGACRRHMECVECRAFGTGPKKERCDQECGDLTVTMVETTADLPETGETIIHCKMMNPEDFCIFYYSLSSTGRQSTVVRAKQCT